MVEDKIARKLEDAGLWRRAAVWWLEVMQRYGLTDQKREWIRLRRMFCLSCVPPAASPEKLDITDIARAADDTLAEMGIVNVHGAVFRQYR
ncbi:PerC family transcriptional regulator [Salmonella enterica subsp. enterica serovar Panama]|uniref:PerC family transcriptional regulator n=1 Tax=Salmonella enterica subsp. enterica serovar Panama TaxID=29472 RepID=A0A751YXX8_SALET|nr:PerC family transcriptional regulator [Salmonella enterica subsp. enterica serovar Sandiego]EBR3741097.1 PerC family transcriptional regulator [Salmonella enterica]EGS7285510.1 PerC family transcriptional regulator [Salmonella enterica subsp. enterica serovar Panama]EGS7544062.1 PerC family transcriptional regulator [Salmonella enterica subsp. enterica serovar Panama]EHC9769098.1 PerC family transcriptional regulator [Salmonella enterica subsp. enterica serovar Panama]